MSFEKEHGESSLDIAWCNGNLVVVTLNATTTNPVPKPTIISNRLVRMYFQSD